jgi:hypothetical protein
MVPGFNSRVAHGDVEYHVQTEDLGQARPTVLTLVYRGGAIVLREKLEYGDILGAHPQAAQVKTLMEAQHRRIMRRVEAGLTAADAPDPVQPSATLASDAPRTGGGPSVKTVDDLIAEYLRSRRQARAC